MNTENKEKKVNAPNFVIHCNVCRCTENIVMQPHYIDKKLIGLIFVCTSCYDYFIEKGVITIEHGK